MNENINLHTKVTRRIYSYLQSRKKNMPSYEDVIELARNPENDSVNVNEFNYKDYFYEANLMGEEMFLVRFILIAVLVFIGTGGIYMLCKKHGAKNTENQNNTSAGNIQMPKVDAIAPPQPKPVLLLMLETQSVRDFFGNVPIAENVKLTVKDGVEFRKLQWFVLPGQPTSVIENIKTVTNPDRQDGYAVLFVILAENKMKNFSKDSTDPEKRRALESLQGSELTILGTVSELNSLDSLGLNFYCR